MAAHEETSPLRWKQPRLKCAHSCLHKKQCKERLSDNRKIHTQVKNWRNMYENEQPRTEKHWTASKMEKKYRPKSRKWQNLLRTSTALKVKRQMLSDVCSSLFPCGAHSARNGQGQTSELRVPGCVLRVAACESSFVAVFRAPSVSACSRFWMLMDGVWWWCSTWCCLIFLLNGVWQGERKSAEKDALFSLGLLWLTLACAKLVCFCGGCACYLSFRFVFGKERGNSRRWRRRGERQHAYEQTQKKCHRGWQQPATHARKLDFTSTRQQTSMRDNRNIKNQVQKYWWIL